MTEYNTDPYKAFCEIRDEQWIDFKYKIIHGTIVECEEELNKLSNENKIDVVQMCANENITVILIKEHHKQYK